MRRFSVRPTLTLKGRKFKGLRGWAGKPLHPPLTHIPVTAFGGSLVYDYGFNVETAGDHPVWHKSEQDRFPGQH